MENRNLNINYRNHMSLYHDLSDRNYQKMTKMYHQYIKFLKLHSADRILDVGCGEGFFLEALAEAGLHSEGCDLSPQQIEAAKNRGLNAYITDNLYTNIIDNRYDIITLFDVLEHIPVDQQILALQTLRQKLKPGGQILIRVPNASSMFAGHYRYVDWTHYSSFTTDSLHFVLKEAGFSSIHIRDDYFGRLPVWFPRPNLIGVLRFIVFGMQRLKCIAQFGWRDGNRIPLAINIIGAAIND